LAEATAGLEQVEARMGEELSERRGALENLLSRINARSEELEDVTRSFTALVEESLHSAEAKARQIGTVLADSAQATTRAIGEQFDRLRSTTGEESTRTAASLRTAYEEVIAEMTAALGAATGRFHEATGELRGIAAQIEQELEATRAELRRGVIDIPQETEEATANMRRVVADQIKALNELSELVSRSNRAVDAAPPVPTPRRVNDGSVAELRPTQSPTAPRSGEPPARRSRTAESREASGSISPHDEQAPEPDEQDEGTWLPQLLTNASQDGGSEPAPNSAQERTKPSTLQSLDSISGNIARMIDHEATVEAWERHRRGEHGVFTRRLYTVQGQQSFQEIRRKYRRDGEFKRTVDRYVEEFERLLSEVGRNDRDRSLAQTYLTSETGKVYTMLAHASGRLD
jgi:hypothetical protein